MLDTLYNDTIENIHYSPFPFSILNSSPFVMAATFAAVSESSASVTTTRVTIFMLEFRRMMFCCFSVTYMISSYTIPYENVPYHHG